MCAGESSRLTVVQRVSRAPPDLNKSELARNQSGWCQQRKQKKSNPSIQGGREYLCLEQEGTNEYRKDKLTVWLTL